MLIPAQPEKKSVPPTLQTESRINPSPLLPPLSPQMAKPSDNPKREFQAICDSLPAPPPPPTSTKFTEERAKPLDQSNLFLTYFRSRRLLLQGEGDTEI